LPRTALHCHTGVRRTGVRRTGVRRTRRRLRNTRDHIGNAPFGAVVAILMARALDDRSRGEYGGRRLRGPFAV